MSKSGLKVAVCEALLRDLREGLDDDLEHSLRQPMGALIMNGSFATDVLGDGGEVFENPTVRIVVKPENVKFKDEARATKYRLYQLLQNLVKAQIMWGGIESKVCEALLRDLREGLDDDLEHSLRQPMGALITDGSFATDVLGDGGEVFENPTVRIVVKPENVKFNDEACATKYRLYQLLQNLTKAHLWGGVESKLSSSAV